MLIGVCLKWQLSACSHVLSVPLFIILKKNLYSYASQIIFENMSRRKKSWGEKYYFYSCLLIFVLFLLVFILTAVLGCCFNCSCSLTAVVAFAFILCLVYTIFVVIAGGHAGVISRTRSLWKLEARRCPPCHACSKIDNWASFVHCGQSCCFAWLIGCAIVQDSSCYCCRVFSCGPDKGPLWQVTFVLLILMFEAFFDWHRYQHVLAITENNNK